MTSLIDMKSALITKLKSFTSVLALLADPLEIRELEWQSTKFSYPNIRIRVSEFNRQISNATCNMFDVIAVIHVFGEDASSLLTDKIASEIFNLLDTKSFSVGTVKFTGIKAKQFGAAWVQESGAWQSIVELRFQAS